jgi:succinate dehydrogenase hydrophobic anchor subunit
LGQAVPFIETLNAITSIFCLTLWLIGLRHPVHQRLDQALGLLFLLAGIYYGFRTFGWQRAEDFLIALFQLQIFIVSSRVFKIAFRPRVRIYLFALCVCIAVTSLFDSLYRSPLWLSAMFVYQISVFSILLWGASAQAIHAVHPYEKRIRTSLAGWLCVVLIVVIADWLLSELFHRDRISALLLVFCAHWLIFVLGSSPIESYYKEIRRLLADGVFVAILFAVLMAQTHSGNVLIGLQVGFIYFVARVAYRTLAMRYVLGAQPPSAVDQQPDWTAAGKTEDQVLELVTSARVVKAARFYSQEDCRNFQIATFIEELKLDSTPAFTPVSSVDWISLESRSEKERQIFLFAWDALDADCLIYLPSSEKVLAIQLFGFGLEVETRRWITQMGRMLRDTWTQAV